MFDALLGGFHFLRPYLLLLIIPSITLIFLRYRSIDSNAYAKYISPHLLKHILLSRKQDKIFNPLNVNLCFLILLLIAAAGPSCRRVKSPFSVDESKLLIAISTSETMDTQDVLPSRIERAKLKVLELLPKISSSVAIAMFSRDSYLALPFTRDRNATIPFIKAAESSIMPEDGNRVSSLLEVLPGLFKKGEKGQYLLIIADEADVGAFRKLKQASQDFGFESLVYGVGLKKSSEQFEAMNEDSLKKLAAELSGSYI